MTALADISKTSHMTVAALRGSDLAEFNETHPRDEGGRFARVADAPSREDPRIARMARLKRRQRRGAAEAIAAHQAAVTSDVRVGPTLESLRQERIRPTRERIEQQHKERVEAKVKERQQQKAKAPQRATVPKFKGNANSKIDLNDESQANANETMTLVKVPSFIVVDPDHAMELLARKSFVVGAAEKRWGVNMTAFSHRELRKYAKTNDLRGKVLLEISNDWWTDEGVGMQPHGVSMATAQYLSTDLNIIDDLAKAPQPFGFKTNGVGKYDLPTIPVNADDFEFANLTLARYPAFKERPPTKWTPTAKAASAMDWDEDEHPRDPETGKFMRLHTGPGGPPSGPTDPRIARERRRRRRIRRGLAEVASVQMAQASPGLELVRRERIRPERVLRVRERLTRVATEAVKEAIPSAPKNAKVVLTARGTPKEVALVHEKMQSHYDFAQEALDRAKAGTGTEEDHVFLSRAFLSGTRREMPKLAVKPVYSPRGEFLDVHRDDEHDHLAPLKTPFTRQEISQMERQLAASLTLFAAQKAAGATGWKMDLEPVPRTRTEITADTQVAVPATELAWLLPISQGIDPLTDLKPGGSIVDEESAYGTPIMRMGRYRDLKTKAAYHQERIDEYERFEDSVARAGDAVRALFTDQELSSLPDRPLTQAETAAYRAEMARRMGLPLAAERIEFLEERRKKTVAEAQARSDPRVAAAHQASLQRLRDRWKKQQSARQEIVEDTGDENALHAARSSASGLSEEYFEDEGEMIQAYNAALQQGGKEGQEAADAITAQWIAQNDPSHRPRKQ